MDIATKMRRDWDRRASEHARFWIATEDYQDDARFAASGETTAASLLDQLADCDTRHWRALEIGCGIGRVLRPLSPHFAHLIGVDVSAEMIAQSRSWLSGLHNVETLACSGVDLAPIPDASLELVYAYVAFQHMPREVFSAYLAEANRVLAEGGRLLFQAYLGPSVDRPLGDTISLRVYRHEELAARLAAAGFAALAPIPDSDDPASRWVLARRVGASARAECDGDWRSRECGEPPSPLDLHLREHLAERLLAAGESHAALRAYAGLVQAEPDHLAAWLTLVSLHVERGDLEAGVAELERLCARHPGYAPAAESLRALRARRNARRRAQNSV